MRSDTKGDGEAARRTVLCFGVPWSLADAGGVNVVVRRLLRGVPELAPVRSVLLVSDWAQKRARVEEGVYGTEIFMRMRPPVIRGHMVRSFVAYVVGLPRCLWTLGRLWGAHNIAGVNLHYPGLWCFSLVLLCRLAWRRRGRVALSFHGTDLSAAAKATGLERRAMRWMVQHADAVTACSQSLATEVEEFFAMARGSVRVIHNGADVEALEADLRQCKAAVAGDAVERWLLNIGTFEPTKGQDVLIRAVASVAAEFPDVGAILVGRAGPHLAVLRTLARDLGVEDRIVFREDVPHREIASYLKLASMVVLPSRREAFGITTLEAGVAGLPVVASRVGGIPEVIDSESVGVLVEPDDPGALAEAIAGLLRDPERCERLGAALRARVRQRFSWDRTCEGYLDAVLPEWREAGGQRGDG